jgi:hypothetical protein
MSLCTRRPCVACLIAVALAGSSVSHAQETSRPAESSRDQSASPVRNTASILFERNLNTLNWIGRALVDTAIGGTHIRFMEQFTSNIILVEGSARSGKRKLISDRNNVLLRVGQPLTRSLSAEAMFSSLVYSDNKAVGISSASSHVALGGVRYAPVDLFSITPLVGYRWEHQTNMKDRGLSYLLSAETNDLTVDGYRLSGFGQYQQDRINPRLLENHVARAGAQRNFEGRTRDSLEVGFARNRREFHVLSDGSIESRVERVLSFGNLLDYEIDKRLLASLFVNIFSRDLDKDTRYPGDRPPGAFDTRIEEFRLDTYVQAEYQSEDLRTSGSARFSYTERTENHSARPIPGTGPAGEIQFNQRNRQEQTKDNVARRTSLSGRVGFPLSLSDRVSVSGSASILRYDTPSDANVEDRDELLIAMSVATSHRLSRYLEVSVALDGNLNKIVYLLGQRSANNYVNRVLRLAPVTTYRPVHWFVTVNAFEVLANYTVYDFEQQVALVRSFSYRQFGWMDSTSIEFGDRVGLDFLSYLKLYERGQLRWSEFTERRENSFVDETYAVQVRFTPERSLMFALGFRYFGQKRYSYAETGRMLEQFSRSMGPTCSILWRMNRHSEFRIQGWYEHRTQPDGARASLPNMMMNIQLHF